MPEMPYQPNDRRPIAARRWALAQRAADMLARRGVSPNAISVAGMVCGIIAGVCFWGTGQLSNAPSEGPAGLVRALFLLAALFIQLRLLANLLDGMVAVASEKASALGELYNDVPDRVSDACTLIGAGYALGGLPELGYVAACLALLTAYVRAVGKVAGAPQEYCGPMAKQQRMFILTLLAVYCGLAPFAWQPVWRHFRGLGLISAGLALIIAGCAVTAARRLVRIAHQLRTKHS